MEANKQIAFICNPVSQNGAAKVAAERVGAAFDKAIGRHAYDIFTTQSSNHAVEIAENLPAKYNAIIAVGGDGLVNEVVNGLMRIDKPRRPALGVIPFGSGNDYASTLGMSYDVDEAAAQILKGNVQEADVGLVNGRYFVETLSFGIDAAIALETMERRKRTGRTGTRLYLESGIDQLLHNLHPICYEMELTAPAKTGSDLSRDVPSDALHRSGQSITFAVQVGPTYGGNFKICPHASIDDGMFDICIAHPPVSIPKAIYIFLRAKSGKHLDAKPMEFFRAEGLHLEFDCMPPAQVDGEKIEGTAFDIKTVPAALRVLMGA